MGTIPNPTTIDSNQMKLEWWPKTVDFLEIAQFGGKTEQTEHGGTGITHWHNTCTDLRGTKKLTQNFSRIYLLPPSFPYDFITCAVSGWFEIIKLEWKESLILNLELVGQVAQIATSGYDKKISLFSQKWWNYIKQKRTTPRIWLDYINLRDKWLIK